MFQKLFARQCCRAVAFWVLALGMLSLATPEARAQNNAPLGVHNIIQNVQIVNNQLVATTTQGQSLPITTTASRPPRGRNDCAILNLELGPINLNLLGLQVTTSEICVRVLGERRGGVLGRLLCNVANLLRRGVSLRNILNRMSAQERTLFTNAVRDILNEALNSLNQARVQSITPAQNGGCPILNLVLGPINLNVLGLRVQVDNCARPAGPVTVNVTAIPGSLLGDLLCGLLGNINVGATLQQVLQQAIEAILGALQPAPG